MKLSELGQTQPPTPVYCDNDTAAGIVNGTIKKQCSRSMEMQYFYVYDQVKHKQYDVRWHPGQENLGDHTRKYHLARHHMQVRPIFFQIKNPQKFLPRAMIPIDLWGCVGKSAGGYIWVSPLTHIPSFRS